MWWFSPGGLAALGESPFCTHTPGCLSTPHPSDQGTSDSIALAGIVGMMSGKVGKRAAIALDFRGVASILIMPSAKGVSPLLSGSNLESDKA